MINFDFLAYQEAEIKRILIEEIRNNCEMKLKEDLKRLKSQEDKLSNYKQVFLLQNEKLKNFVSKKDEHLNSMNVLKHEIEQDIISKKILIEKFSEQFLNNINCFDFVIVKNPNNKFIELLTMEATIEDMFIIIKRGFEKGNISFNETVKFIRNLSREAIKIKFIRDKIMKEYEKINLR